MEICSLKHKNLTKYKNVLSKRIEEIEGTLNQNSGNSISNFYLKQRNQLVLTIFFQSICL